MAPDFDEPVEDFREYMSPGPSLLAGKTPSKVANQRRWRKLNTPGSY
jgi:hypothetical protein